jgi:hypothetical protein
LGRPLTTAATWANFARMPRKSAAAIALLEPRGHRLEPPPDLCEAERVAFVAAVRSVKPGHFAAEDVPLLDEPHLAHPVGRRLGVREAWQASVVNAAEFAVNIRGLRLHFTSAAMAAGYLSLQSRPVRVRSWTWP